MPLYKPLFLMSFYILMGGCRKGFRVWRYYGTDHAVRKMADYLQSRKSLAGKAMQSKIQQSIA